VDSHCDILLRGSPLVSCDSGHAGRLASLIGMNLGRSWKQAIWEEVCVRVHFRSD
jgi:hypothetical protein